MKATYRIFANILFLNIVAIIMLLFTLQMFIVGILGINEVGFHYFVVSNFIYIIFFFIYLCLDIWILTATFLPIIKIDNDGISAYSIFWKRHIQWDEIKTVKLLKSSYRRAGVSSFSKASVTFEITKKPETKNNAMTNNGVRVKTFIIISQKNYQIPDSLSLGGQLLTHGKMTTKQDIAFEFEVKAWEMIQRKINS